MITKTIALGLALLSGPSLMSQQYPFEMLWTSFPPSSNDIDTDPSRDVVLVDIDGDGDLDSLVANLDVDNALYLNDGFGKLRREISTPFTSDGGNSRGLAVADIDGDGDLDVFVANSTGQKNFLYENQTGSHVSFVRRTSGPVVEDVGNSRQAVFFDADGDGDPDLYVTNFNGQDNWLYLNQGGLQNGTMGQFQRHHAGDAVNDGQSSYGVAHADVDGDGDQDLFVTNHSSVVGGPGAPNFLYLNDGAGNFSVAVGGLQSLDASDSLACAFADMDNDGDQDLFVGNGTAQQNQVFLNNGSGLFNKRGKSDLTTDRGRSIGSAWFDFDKDGDVDVLVANRSPNMTSELFINTGDAQFRRHLFGPMTEYRKDTYDVAAGDLDLDGHVDLMLANLAGVNDQFRNLGAQWVDLGHSLEGGLGMPTLSSTGNCMPSTMVKLTLDRVPDFAKAYLAMGTQASAVGFLGGVLTVDPNQIMRVFSAENTGDDNTLVFTAMVPPDGIPTGVQIVFQGWIVDPSGPEGFSATNGLQVQAP